MEEITNHGKLIKTEEGIYTKYVFQLDDGKYIMCTQLPNWGVFNIKKGDTGFITIQQVNAGEPYYDRETGTSYMYNYSNIYFKDFIKDDINNSENIIL